MLHSTMGEDKQLTQSLKKPSRSYLKTGRL